MTVRAVLTPPQEQAFREVCGVVGPVDTHFHGWSKRVILTTDRVFLFPRDHTRVPNLDREGAALEALGGVGPAPRLIAYRQDDRISPYPFLEVQRVPGAPFYGEVYEAAELDVVFELMSQLGPAIADWHRRPTTDLAPILHDAVPRPGEVLGRALADDPSQLAAEAATVLDVPRRPDWIDAIGAIQSLPPVLAHGDVHGEQLITADNVLTGIIDWETAALDNPVRDFNFREWGRGWYRAHERDFPTIRERLWRSYAEARPAATLPDWRTVHLFFSLIEAWECAISTRRFDIERRPLARTILIEAST
ncbi:MAG: aminoglycoside phosphotransferase family protein [Actinomycetota bacterium]